jgi:Alginate export
VGCRFAPFEVSTFKLTPKLGVRAHYASGDDNLKSTAFHNFTAAYPAASVISEMSLISVSNVKNLQPYVQFFVSPNAVFGASWNFVRK